MAKKERIMVILFWVIAVVTNMMMCIMNYCTDSTYCVAMAYRMVRGDRLFMEMWEPHQTSVFIPFLLVKLFIFIFGSTEGIVLWMHVWGMLFFLMVSILLIFRLKKYLPEKTVHLMALFLFISRPKYVNMPDYANMAVLFTVLLWIYLISYILDKKIYYLIATVFFTCCAILAYPSNVLMIIPVIVLIFLFSENKRRDSVVFSGGVVSGLVIFAGCVCVANKMSPKSLLDSLFNIFLGDSHSSERYSGWAYLQFAVYGLVFILCLIIIATLICHLKKKKGTRVDWIAVFGRLLIVFTPLLTISAFIYSQMANTFYEWIYLYLVIYPTAIICGVEVAMRQKLAGAEKILYISGTVISLSFMLNVIILTNLSLITVFGYTSLAVMCSFIPLGKLANESKTTNLGVYVWGVVTAHIIFLALNPQNKKDNYVRIGPEKWMAAKLSYCNRVKVGYEEWKSNVDNSDVVMILKDRDYELAAYLYMNAEISNYSVISTPSNYQKQMEEYWSEYPEKTPTVFAVPCWMGEESLIEPEWLCDYVNNNYERVYTGVFWNFYRAQNTTRQD